MYPCAYCVPGINSAGLAHGFSPNRARRSKLRVSLSPLLALANLWRLCVAGLSLCCLCLLLFTDTKPMIETSVTFLGRRVRILVADITSQKVDAIVNAANSTLLGGGGVDGAIHRRGGPRILEECRKLRASRFPQGLPTGEAVLTSAGALPAKYVIHTVGPIVRGGRAPDSALLAACYRNSLAVAAEHQLRSIAFPAISTGAYGYPREQAAPIVSATVESFLRRPTPIAEVRLVFYDPSDADIFLRHHTFSA